MEFSQFKLDPKVILESPKVEFPVIKNDLFNFTSFTTPIVNCQIDCFEQQVKNSNDFSKRVLTSGGWMYEKSRSPF